MLFRDGISLITNQMKNICILFVLLLGFLYTKGQYQPPNNIVIDPTFQDFAYYIVSDPWSVPCGNSSLWFGYLNTNTNMYHVLCVLKWENPTQGTPGWALLDTNNTWNVPNPPYSRSRFLLSLYSEFPDTILTHKEYIQGSLIHELNDGGKYCVAFYVLFDSFSWVGTNFYGFNVFHTSSLGIFFSNNKISRNDDHAFYEYYPPQIQNPLDRFLTDSVNWMLVSGSFVAEGGEKYITIGNFLPDTLTPTYQFMPNNTVYAGASTYLIGFVGVYDCTGHDYTCNAGEDMRICNGQVVQLGTDDPPEADKRQYRWSPALGLSDGTAAKPLASPTETTTYTLYVIDEFLQESYDTVTVEVIYCDIFIPNIFSPNGDGQNDVLYVRGQGIEQLSFVVYNRWGQKVFETKDPNHGWDGTINGKPAETGVYVYHVTAVLHDGLVVSRYGDVTLVR